jgi:hypothetical protein
LTVQHEQTPIFIGFREVARVSAMDMVRNSYYEYRIMDNPVWISIVIC